MSRKDGEKLGDALMVLRRSAEDAVREQAMHVVVHAISAHKVAHIDVGDSLPPD